MAAVKLSPLFSFAFFLKCQHLSTEENYLSFKIDTHDISKLDIKFWKVFFFFAITVISHKIKSSQTF